jgi:N-acetylneuraminic acid mutarotase
VTVVSTLFETPISSLMKTIIRSSIILNLVFPVFLMAQGVWTQKASYQGAPRYYFIGYALNNKGYMGSGSYGGVYSYLSDYQEFDPVQNSWTQMAPFPMPFRFGAGFAAGNFGYATGGLNEATFIYDTYEYNQTGNNWSSKAPLITTRSYATGVGAGNFGYIIGGNDMMANPMNDCWEYNQPANTWSEKASLPPSAARSYATGFSANGKVYIFGGSDGQNVLNDLWEFNPLINTWSQKASLPGAGRQQAMAFVINNIAYLVGGFPATAGILKDFWKYDPLTDQWVQLADFSGTTGPAGGVGFTINGSGYVVCGNGTNECWEYMPQITGISGGAVNMQTSIFPNPSSNKIFVKTPAGLACMSASIYNVTGKLVLLDHPSGHSGDGIDISNLQPGFYLLKVKTDSGTTLNGTFIKSVN